MNPALEYALQVLALIAKLAAEGDDVAELAKSASAVLKRNDAPTDAEWEALNNQTEALEARIREPKRKS